MKKYILITLAFILLACGSKKISTNSNIKEKTEFDLKDNSVSSSKVDFEKQYTNATTNERIVTMYGYLPPLRKRKTGILTLKITCGV